MTAKYKFPSVPLRFEDQTSPSAHGVVINVVSTSDEKNVGVIKWHKNFEAYLFQGAARKILNHVCHKMISEYLRAMNKDRKLKPEI